jgi:hypothetical protein
MLKYSTAHTHNAIVMLMMQLQAFNTLREDFCSSTLHTRHSHVCCIQLHNNIQMHAQYSETPYSNTQQPIFTMLMEMLAYAHHAAPNAPYS